MNTTTTPETDTEQQLRALLCERTNELAMLTRELIRVQDALAATQAELVRERPMVAEPTSMSAGQADEMSARLEAAERHIEDLYNSTSWRITAPMRALSRALRGR